MNEKIISKYADNQNKPKMSDVANIISDYQNEVDFESKEDSSGSRSLKYDGKNQVYFYPRQYGISFSYQVSGKWKTDRLKTISSVAHSIDRYLDDNCLLVVDEPKPSVNILKESDTVDVENVEHLVPEIFDYFERPVINDLSDYEIFEKLIDQSKNVLLIGPTGSGKTTLARFYCAKNKKPYMRVSLNGGATVEDLVGHWIIKSDENKNQVTVWVDGLLTQACRHGYVLVIDEINAASAEVLFKLNSLLDDERILILTEKDGEILEPHPDFRFVATCNPTELGYAGTQELNEALLDRFQGHMYIDYNTSVERKILKKLPLSLEQVENIQNFADKIRKAYTNGEIFTPLSTRTLINLGDLYSQGLESMIQYRFKQSERDIINDNIDILLHPDATISTDDNTVTED